MIHSVKATACSLLRDQSGGLDPSSCITLVVLWDVCHPMLRAHSVRDGPGSINRSCKLHMLEVGSGRNITQITVSDIEAEVRCLALGVLSYLYIGLSDMGRVTVGSEMILMMDHLNMCRTMSCIGTEALVSAASQMTYCCCLCLLCLLFWRNVPSLDQQQARPLWAASGTDERRVEASRVTLPHAAFKRDRVQHCTSNCNGMVIR